MADMFNRFNTAVYCHSPVWMQNFFCTMVGKRYLKLRYGGEYQKWLTFYQGSRNWSEAELLEYQREQIKDLVTHCYRTVPFYRDKWRSEGISPDDLKDVCDLAKFPDVTKEDLFEAGQSIVSESVDPRSLIVTMTGGSTGMPLPCHKLPTEIQRHYAIGQLCCRPGVTRGDRYATFQGKEVVPHGQSKPPYWRENRAVNQRLYSMNHLSPEKLHAYAESLVATPFVFYQGYVSIMTVVAEFMAQRGIKLKTPPKAVFTTSEQLTKVTRKLFEETWQTRVWDQYGQGEFCSLIPECEHGNHHVQMDYGIVEYEPIGREDDLLLAEIVCTGFIRRAAPLIRYRVGDRVLLDENEVCPCGRPGPVIKAIRGRIGECILTPDGRKYPHISLIVDLLRNVRRTQVLQERPEEITVRVVPFPQYTEKDEKHLVSCFEDRIGGGIQVQLEYVSELERLPNGKILSIINRVPGYGGDRSKAGGHSD